MKCHFHQRCQQATFFRPGLACGLAWSRLTQPGGQSAVACLVPWPGLAWPGLQAKPGQAIFLIFQIFQID